MFICDDLPLFLFCHLFEGLGHVPELFKQFDDGQTDDLECFHKPMKQWSFTFPQIVRFAQTARTASSFASANFASEWKVAAYYAQVQ